MFRIRYVACVALIAGCPEQKPEIGAVDAGLTPISHPITSTKTATTSAIIRPTNLVEPKPSCSGAPKWVSQPPCLEDGFLYAAGELKSESTTYVARAAAANRARKRLALAMGAHENDSFTLQGSEIDQVYACEGAMYALARVKHRPSAEFSACSADSIVPPQASGRCPAWTSRMAWMDGPVMYGVAPTFKIMNKFQAEQAAVNRARQVVSEMVAIDLQLTPEGVTASTKPTPLRELRRSTADCTSGKWIMVAFEMGAGNEAMLRPQPKGPVDKMKIK